MRTFEDYLEELEGYVLFVYDWYADIPMKWGTVANYCTTAQGFLKNINPSCKPFIVSGGSHHTGSIRESDLTIHAQESERMQDFEKAFKYAFSDDSSHRQSEDYKRNREGFTHIMTLGTAMAVNMETETIAIEMQKAGRTVPHHPFLNTYKTLVVMGFNGTIIHESAHSIFSDIPTMECLWLGLKAALERDLPQYNKWFLDLSDTLAGEPDDKKTTLAEFANSAYQTVEDVAMEAWMNSQWPQLYPFLRGKNLLLFNPAVTAMALRMNAEAKVTLDKFAMSAISVAKVADSLQDVLFEFVKYIEDCRPEYIAAANGAIKLARQVDKPFTTLEERTEAVADIIEYLCKLKEYDASNDTSDAPEEFMEELLIITGTGDGEEIDLTGLPQVDGSSLKENEEDDDMLTENQQCNLTTIFHGSVSIQINSAGAALIGRPTSSDNEREGELIVQKLKFIVNDNGTADYEDDVPILVERIPWEPDNPYDNKRMNQIDTNFGQHLRRVNVRKTIWESMNYARGKIVPHMLYRAGFDAPIYGLPSTGTKKDTGYEFYILVDASSSMSCGHYQSSEFDFSCNFEAAYGVAWALYKSLRQVDIPCHVYYHMACARGFWSAEDNIGVTMGKVASPEMPYRVVETNMRTMMSIHSEYPNETMSRYQECFYSNNMDGYAINYMRRRVIGKRSRRKKVLIVVSDGAPNSYEYNGTKAVNHSKQNVDKLRREGVIVKSLSIHDDCVSDNNQIYGRDHNEVAGVEGLINTARKVMNLDD